MPNIIKRPWKDEGTGVGRLNIATTNPIINPTSKLNMILILYKNNVQHFYYRTLSIFCQLFNFTY